MSDPSPAGIVYTEHSPVRANTPILSLWSFHTAERGRDRRPVARHSDGTQEFWLERSDPLLNTILPGMDVSLVANVGDLWAAGRSLAASALIPRVGVIGPCTQPRILGVGRSVHAIGAVLLPPARHEHRSGADPSSRPAERVAAVSASLRQKPSFVLGGPGTKNQGRNRDA